MRIRRRCFHYLIVVGYCCRPIWTLSLESSSSTSSSASSAPIVRRYSRLVPWNKEHRHVELGWGVEERIIRSDESRAFQISVEWSHQADGEIAAGSDSTMRKTTATSVTRIIPDLGQGGSLGSSLWPTSMAASMLLLSPTFASLTSNKSILELGCGVGLPGLVAAQHAATCLLTDNHEEVIDVLQDKTIPWNQDQVTGILASQRLDWRDVSDDDPLTSPPTTTFVDFVLGVEVAYYYYLLRPLMDTIKKFVNPQSGYSVVIGQANRESQWDLYKNICKGCYNQRTDQHERPWSGSCNMLLYHLESTKWIEQKYDDHGNLSFTKDDFDSNIDGDIPISVIVYHSNEQATLPAFSPYDHIATVSDDENIMKTF